MKAMSFFEVVPLPRYGGGEEERALLLGGERKVPYGGANGKCPTGGRPKVRPRVWPSCARRLCHVSCNT